MFKSPGLSRGDSFGKILLLKPLCQLCSSVGMNTFWLLSKENCADLQPSVLFVLIVVVQISRVLFFRSCFNFFFVFTLFSGDIMDSPAIFYLTTYSICRNLLRETNGVNFQNLIISNKVDLLSVNFTRICVIKPLATIET